MWRAFALPVKLSTALLLLTTVACSAIPSRRPEQRTFLFVHPEQPGSSFDVLGLVAGDDSRSARAITTQVRMRLEGIGLTVLRSPGLWQGEDGALDQICNREGADGVVFVWWNQITLRACQGGDYPTAFRARSGSGEGLDPLVNMFLRYLGPRTLPEASDPAEGERGTGLS